MIVIKFTFNNFHENTYLLHDAQKNAVIIDPGNSCASEDMKLFDFIDLHELKLSYILLTHAHIDHVLGVSSLINKFKTINLALHGLDFGTYTMQKEMQHLFGFNSLVIHDIDVNLENYENFSFGSILLKIFFTPGHAPGHVSFYHEPTKQLISGDVLFKGGIGRTDLPGGDLQTLKESIKSRLFVLPEETIVYSGHGDQTTIGEEKKYNPFF